MSLSLDKGLAPAVLKREAMLAPYQAQLANTAERRREAYQIRYKSYLSFGHIEPNATEQFCDIYDDMSNSRTVVIYKNGVPAASVRTCTFSAGTGERSPALDTYPNEANAILTQIGNIGFGQRGIETTRLVRSPAFENDQGLVFLLYRMAGYVGMVAHTQMLFACVRTNHVSFYKRLGYQTAAEPKAYPGLTCPMQLMVCTRERYDEVRMAYPVIDPYTNATGSLDEFLDGAPVGLSIAIR